MNSDALYDHALAYCASLARDGAHQSLADGDVSSVPARCKRDSAGDRQEARSPAAFLTVSAADLQLRPVEDGGPLEG